MIPGINAQYVLKLCRTTKHVNFSSKLSVSCGLVLAECEIQLFQLFIMLLSTEDLVGNYDRITRNLAVQAYGKMLFTKNKQPNLFCICNTQLISSDGERICSILSEVLSCAP